MDKGLVMDDEEYRVSPRVVLRAGDFFTASAGPYFLLASGEECSLAAKGPFKFKRVLHVGEAVLIHAIDRGGAFAALHVSGDRETVDSRIVPRPYKIRSKKRAKK